MIATMKAIGKQGGKMDPKMAGPANFREAAGGPPAMKCRQADG
jgi:hypothetical protein